MSHVLLGTAAAVGTALTRGALQPLDGEPNAIPEVEAIQKRGYAVWFRRRPASKSYEPWVFAARWRGRTVGRLDVDFILAGRRLYVANVYVVEAHGMRGIGSALVLAAAKATGCRVVTTSSRTGQGARFFAKIRPVLKGYGVELRDPTGGAAGGDS